MAEHESPFTAAVAAIRPLLLGGTIRDAERIALAAVRAANAAADAEHPLARAAREQGVRPWTAGEQLTGAPMDDEEYAAFTAALAECRTDPTDQLREQLAAATQRAATAEADAVQNRKLRHDLALSAMLLVKRTTTERDDARARLAELGEATVEWTVPLDGENGSPLPEKLARRMAAERWIPLMTRTAYREPPWRPAEEAADATAAAPSATQTDAEHAQAHGDGSHSSATRQEAAG